MNEYIRICPSCKKELKYSLLCTFDVATSKNKMCKSCSHKGNYLSKEQKLKISNSLKGRIFSDETKIKMSLSQIGYKNHNFGKKQSEKTKEKRSNSLKNRKLTEIHKQNLSISNIGKQKGHKHPNYGKHRTDDTKRKISEKQKGKIISESTIIKLSASHKGLRLSEETKLKLRLHHIKKIEERYGQMFPNYNPKGCQVFNNLMEETNTFIQHAENGGEYHIKELGYWVDGYDEKNNIVYEYDEKRHFDVYGNLKEKDIKREKQIIDFLKCKIIRIDDK